MVTINVPNALFANGYYTEYHHTDQTPFDATLIAAVKLDRFFIELSHDPNNGSLPTPILISSGTMSFNDDGTVADNATLDGQSFDDLSSAHIEPMTGTEIGVGDFTATTDTGQTWTLAVYPRLIGLRFDSYQGTQEGSPVVGYLIETQNTLGASATYFFPTADQDLSQINLPYPDGTIEPAGYTHSVITHYDELDDYDSDASGTYVAYDDLYDGLPSQFTGAICFCQGTLIHTQHGQRKIEDLEIGDLIWTFDHGYKPLLWKGCSTLSRRDLRERENLRPIRIQAGSLGERVPETDLFVSPQHRIHLRPSDAYRVCASNEVLIPAKDLIGIAGIERVSDLDPVTYYHIMFDDHEIIMANGCFSESFYTGPEAVRALSADARRELYMLFPELMTLTGLCHSPARPFLKGQKARALVQDTTKSGATLAA